MAKSMTWGVNVVIASMLAFLQFLLTPFLTYEGRGIQAILTKDDTLFACLAVFLMVLAASFRSTSRRKPSARRHCAFRALLWGAVMTLFFFELFCCGVLRFEEVPPSRELHGNIAILFFALLWAVAFHILRRSAARPSAS